MTIWRDHRPAALALVMAAVLSACAYHPSYTALTQWGTPCAEYGVPPEDCPARFAGYAQYMAQGTNAAVNNHR